MTTPEFIMATLLFLILLMLAARSMNEKVERNKDRDYWEDETINICDWIQSQRHMYQGWQAKLCHGAKIKTFKGTLAQVVQEAEAWLEQDRRGSISIPGDPSQQAWENGGRQVLYFSSDPAEPHMSARGEKLDDQYVWVFIYSETNPNDLV